MATLFDSAGLMAPVSSIPLRFTANDVLGKSSELKGLKIDAEAVAAGRADRRARTPVVRERS
jgi:hypothetical protein